MNALANIGGGLGLACSGVLAGLMIDAGYSWKAVYYVDTILMERIVEFRLNSRFYGIGFDGKNPFEGNPFLCLLCIW